MNAQLAVRLIKRAHESDPAAERLLSDNRDLYIEQSAGTRGGVVPPIRKVRLTWNTTTPAVAGKGN